MGAIEVEQRGPVLIGTLDNPPHALMDQAMVDDLDALVARAENEDEVRAVVLTGSHPERFVAHFDVAEILAGVRGAPSVGRRAASASLRTARVAAKVPGVKKGLLGSPAAGLVTLEQFHGIFLRMNRCGAVFVAAINGSTQGGGCELSLACDLRLMANAEGSRIGQPEILLGFPPGGGGTQRLARLLGSSAALKIALDGRPLSAARALEVGLVDELVAPGELLGRAVAEAQRLGSRPKEAIAATKRDIYEGGSLPLAEGLHMERAEFMATAGLPEAEEAMVAYLEHLERTGDLGAYDEEAMREADKHGSFAGGNGKPDS